jgi:hypothetical protein
MESTFFATRRTLHPFCAGCVFKDMTSFQNMMIHPDRTGWA